ncbi:hypothetical protein KQI49_17805 [Virgibacillus sp. MSJ-26]|uniref:HTH domain-containing protein n=1 Tax=Virgibacillus sp. MSJ-26 TaxID=2841522 RepID=UPI001C11C09D|nr:HTH domain-containing protein [Virgibacillus sp. MSJ-26]MBU5468668.1 hypothetical protein [Virgibacillus sp. MSJ-26]
MGVNYFSDEQVHELQCHPYVDKVSYKAITYSEDFKVHFMMEYASGKLPTQIFQEAGFDEETWMNIQNDYINKVKNGKLIKVDAAHYIHNIKYKQIAEESKEFLDGLSDY